VGDIEGLLLGEVEGLVEGL